MSVDYRGLVEKLAERAANHTDGGQALAFSQAAVNVANALSISRYFEDRSHLADKEPGPPESYEDDVI